MCCITEPAPAPINSQQNSMRDNDKTTVAVLLATFNGLRWLPEQVNSILGQSGVNVRLFISDDLSTDGTFSWLQDLASQDSRVTLLPQAGKFGSAAANFYRLILDTDYSRCDFIAFSDQDDIWEIDKLSRHARIASTGGFDGVSSNITAFWTSGKSMIIIKSYAQRELDYLFESAGPGCTYLMTPWLLNKLRIALRDPASGATHVALHDWLAYAVCRAAGRKWHIDNTSTLQYRQHDSNEFGANHGLRAKLSRIGRLKGGWYRAEVIKVLNVCMTINPSFPLYADLSDSLCANGIAARMRLLRIVNQARRKVTDRLALSAAILFSLF